MYLKSLEMQGFKSFPDKIELKFDKGITAVVGPNGSGKSNIGDAMRWVMGEQSSKQLRGEKMQGVIFHGTLTRPKAAFAQVTITIDNSDHRLGDEDETVSVSRKLYRNGDSEYMINSKQVRLKDVVELFMDTGLGRDGYSIIGQGRIADIVNEKSNERREIFEEAAGISKFRYKKEEAERKLLQAQDNISRLGDILGELASRIEPLRHQSEKAKKFIVLDEQKRKLEVSLWVKRLDEFFEKGRQLEEKLAAINEQYSALSEELKDVEKEISDNFELSAKKAEEAEELRDLIHETQLKSSKSDSDIAVLENDIEHLKENIARLEEQIDQSKQSAQYLEEQKTQQQKELDALRQKEQDSRKGISDLEDALRKLEVKTDETDKDLSEANDLISSVYVRKSKISFTIENAKNEIADCEEQLAAAHQRNGELEEQFDDASKELRELNEAKNAAEEKRQDSQNRVSGMERLLAAKKEKLEKSSRDFTDTDVAIRETESKLAILRDLESSMEGFAYSVKHIIKASQQGRLSGVEGTVAQLINVRPEYSLAIETALGGAMQNIVVANEETAKRGIRLLKDSGAGRATFLPITSVKGTRLEVSGLEDEEGFVSNASDLAECSERVRSVVDSLLGRIAVFEDIDAAASAAKKYKYKFRIVTLDGQVINAGGSFTGGSAAKKTGILTRKNEIETLEGQKKKLEEKFSQLKSEREKLLQENAKLEADLEALRADAAAVNEDLLRFELEIKRVREFRDGYEKQLDELDELVSDLGKKIAAAQKDITDSTAEMEKTDREIIETEARLSQSQSEQAKLRREREELGEKLSAARIAGAELAKDITACEMSIAQIESTIKSGGEELESIKAQITDNHKSIDDKKNEIGNIRLSQSDAGEEIKRIEKQAEQALADKIRFENEASRLRNSQKGKLSEKEALYASISRTEEQHKNVLAQFDKLVAQLWDDYELTRTGAADVAEEIEDYSEAEKQLTSLRNKIRNLGSINLEAIDEFKEVSERYEFINSQLSDVNTSKAELEELIRDLTENMKSMFIQTFDSINRNFSTIFTELFGGGKGELSLSDPDDVLNCGIDINVQPPGKVITNLMSLSGGEQSLVAVAIYFAILRISPSPFCLLDEIEAALDDVNVTRYAQYLHRLTDRTQFIAITHRRGTMEEADVLYGVTMQEKGISKLLRMDAAE